MPAVRGIDGKPNRGVPPADDIEKQCHDDKCVMYLGDNQRGQGQESHQPKAYRRKYYVPEHPVAA